MNELIVLSQKNTEIVQGFLFEPVALIITGNPTFEEWERIGEGLDEVERGIHWWIGDWLNYGEGRWGEDYAQAMTLTHYKYGTLANDKWVSGRIEVSRRRETLSWSHHQEVAPLEPNEQDKWLDRAEGEGWNQKELRDAIGIWKVRAMGMSESPEWYTPKYIVELTVKLFGEIDLDPCSNSHKVPNVPAGTLYTQEDDGLSRMWHGKVYMNPPYGDEIPAWIEKLVGSYERGEIEAAIALLPGRIDTQWFQPLYDYLICHIRGRLQFVGSSNSAPFPSVIVYLGDNEQGFIDVFAGLGPIMQRIA